MKILIAEDDIHIRNGLVTIMEQEGYTVVTAEDGESALRSFKNEAPELICLDIMMPKLNGYDVCRKIRESGSSVPVIFISAKSEEIDKVLGLELGADDFIVKPFGVKEVVARIRAVTRRYNVNRAAESATDQPTEVTRFEMGDLEVFPDELRARRGEQTFDLSLRDVKVLSCLHEHRGKVLSRNQLFNLCWGEDYYPNSRSLDQQISQLRKRIEVDPKSPKIIQTVHAAGYRFDG